MRKVSRRKPYEMRSVTSNKWAGDLVQLGTWSSLLRTFRRACNLTAIARLWMSDQPPAQTLLALPAPKDDAAPGTITLNVSTGEPVVMDHLGPVVVNVDGTLSRIANWDEMIDHEKELTKRRIAKRNIERLKALAESGELTGEQMSALANPKEE